MVAVTNPLDFPRYVRSLRPALPESLPSYVEDELEKVSTSLQELEEASSNDATAKVSEERIVRVSEDEALAARIVSVEAEFDAVSALTTARIATEEIARASADEALASRVTDVEATFDTASDDTNARITVEELARAAADEALAASIQTVEAEYRASDQLTHARVTQEMYSRSTVDVALGVRIDTVSADYIAADAVVSASVTAEATARASADSAMATNITTLTSNLATTNAAITTEATTRASADTAISGTVSTLSTTVGGHTSTLTTYGTSINGLEARYGVNLNVNGHISGFSQNNSGTVSDFIVVADNFKVVLPGGGTPIVPFEVSAGSVKIQGNLVVSGTITSTQIAAAGVETTNLDTDCVTDMSQASAGGFTGNGSSQTIISTSVTMAEAGDIAVMVSSLQSFAGDKSWSFRLYIDSTLVFTSSGAKIADSVALSGFKSVAAGTIPITIDWTGQDNNVSVSTVQAIMIRRYR